MDIIRYQPRTTMKISITVCFIIGHFIFVGLSIGQEHPGQNGSHEKMEAKWSTFIRGGYVHQFNTDIDNNNGNFTSDRFFVQPGIMYTPDHTRSYSLVIGYGYDGYDFTGENGFAALQPWDDIQSFRLSTPIRFTKGQNWSFFIAPTLRVTGENGADINDSLTGGGFAGFAYKPNKRLTIGPGIGIISQIEDDASIFPVLIINWKVTDSLSLETGRGLGATMGPGISLIWRLTEQWHVTLGGRYEKLRFRLDEKAETPSGIGQDKSIPVFGAITYNFNMSSRVSLTGGLEMAGELQLEDQEGNVLLKQDYENAPFLGFSFYWGF
jgi:hypothetical protein